MQTESGVEGDHGEFNSQDVQELIAAVKPKDRSSFTNPMTAPN
jgi:hypothetical protein